MSNAVTCPSCSHQFEVTEVLAAQLSTQIRAELQRELDSKNVALQQQAESLALQQRELKEAQASLSDQVEETLARERTVLMAKAREQAADELAVQLQDGSRQIAQLREQLKTSQQAELDLRRREQELKDQAERQELDVARRIDEERAKIRSSAIEQADEQHRLKVAEKEQLIQQMQKQIEDLRRKSEQGSQQIQGEVLEVDLEDTLAEVFSADEILPVPKGRNGGDVQQTVRTSTGRSCGMILWESKRTKNFSKQWLPKLRDDQRKAGAECAVIVTEALPEGVKTAAQIDGVWVCSRAYAIAVGMALRAGIIEVSKARNAAEGRLSQSDRAYSYLCSPEFMHHLSGIVESFTEMQKDLESEERSAKSRFRKRRKQLERAFTGTASMYGDLQGLIGNAMPEIRCLELNDESGSNEADTRNLAS